MTKGSVKWFNDAKGFGFILCEEIEDDIFVHYSEIQQEGFKSLEPGEKVQFELHKSPKGFRARNVIPNDQAEAHSDESMQPE
jgi:CspA family cold shock protein